MKSYYNFTFQDKTHPLTETNPWQEARRYREQSDTNDKRKIIYVAVGYVRLLTLLWKD